MFRVEVDSDVTERLLRPDIAAADTAAFLGFLGRLGREPQRVGVRIDGRGAVQLRRWSTPSGLVAIFAFYGVAVAETEPHVRVLRVDR
ncbi:MAG: hypothetical protein IBJ11_08460 [Phycisphaerales bacterium]|nr:hypothetical protein [Phycisphaerales bacterium]